MAVVARIKCQVCARCKQAFLRFRQSTAFAWTIFTVSGSWLLWNWLPGLPHFDDGEGGKLTLLLSIEASIAACFILESGAAQQNHLVGMMQQLLELATQQRRLIDELTKDVDEIVDEILPEQET